MNPADTPPPVQLVGQRVVFLDGPGHETCWHATVGLKTGKVLRAALTLAQKARLLEEGGMPSPRLPVLEEEEPRVWVKADPCPSHPRGCEAAVAQSCLRLSGG
jgi:hypothetical protein